jgi:hypothetical protein
MQILQTTVLYYKKHNIDAQGNNNSTEFNKFSNANYDYVTLCNVLVNIFNLVKRKKKSLKRMSNFSFDIISNYKFNCYHIEYKSFNLL